LFLDAWRDLFTAFIWQFIWQELFKSTLTLSLSTSFWGCPFSGGDGGTTLMLLRLFFFQIEPLEIIFEKIWAKN
jgi:hypothetical protein